MAIYAIGDVQGCFAELQRLLERIRFDPAADRLWFTGDLVNRGPQSLETLRFIRSLGDGAVSVLGNHDLHLLAVAHGVSSTKRKDTFADVLCAPDRDILLAWLRHRPLLHRENGFYLIHAGLPPQWSAEDAERHAGEVEDCLRGEGFVELFRHMYGDQPDLWSETLQAWERLRFITNCFTRVRYCDRYGHTDFKEKGAPGTQPPHLMPWFKVPGRKSTDARFVFGHWSTLGFYAGDGVYSIDTGCLWGGELTALRLDGELRRFFVSCREGGYQEPS
ncbi:diadenosine tetraphosphatase [Methylocaldum marinum]|uniref:Bis(5'-nucleosyl)-tetraphosphatase, symmetrical n=1 Tax=Methylocaldum marinum TaxID=1432792 RepID=A0A250KMG6_9GAMM|nr:symmetrical bis(5'-nucleosyl)-tetraphosphatase [Methylocaldum marinum]BBA32910.1 diadenosine tetraphosphatase [Methylocaldum marinum]